ncbi:MAG: PAS domain-containing protein [Burkholderiales bacterium]|nr:PAS domain-containing protein [Burkholderiales bacterium]
MSPTLNVARPQGGSAGAALGGLDLLATGVLVIGPDDCVAYANQAAEVLLDASRRHLIGHPAQRLFSDGHQLERLWQSAAAGDLAQLPHVVELRRPLREPVVVQVMASALDDDGRQLLLEMTEIEQQLRVSREDRQVGLSEANRQLLRNLAHEIRNPLGGIRGAAQLLERELPLGEQREYTRVIIAEADRLQSLVDRLLAPHRAPRVVAEYSVHELCERVRAVILAEFPRGLEIQRDYDASMPSGRGDKEQLIQALLNIVRNAAQALAGRIADGDAQIVLRTRVARHVTIARRHVRLAAELTVIDNGPGVADEIKDRIFFPLVTGRADGTGLGLTLAQAFVLANDGTIEFDSRPGRTAFRILLPLT